jgi:hypothetical protein
MTINVAHIIPNLKQLMFYYSIVYSIVYLSQCNNIVSDSKEGEAAVFLI